MIEMVYSSKETEELSEVRVPKNIHQIGENTSSRKIYIEDYVMTSLKKKPEDENSIKYGVLLGEIKRAKGNTYVFVKGLVETREVIENSIIFNDDIWASIYKDIKKYFEGLEIIGWFVSVPYTVQNDMSSIQKIHLDNFAGNDKVCYLSDRTEHEDGFFAYDTGGLKKQPGYYIFYEKNEKMKKYLKQTQGSRSVAVTTDKNDVSGMIVDVTRKEAATKQGNSIVTKKAADNKESNNKEKSNIERNNIDGNKIAGNNIEGDNIENLAGKKQNSDLKASKENLQAQDKRLNTEGKVHEKKPVSFREVIKEQVSNEHGKGLKVGGFAYGISSMLIIALLLSTVVMLNNYGELRSLKASIENMSGEDSVEAMNEMLSSIMPTTVQNQESESLMAEGDINVNEGAANVAESDSNTASNEGAEKDVKASDNDTVTSNENQGTEIQETHPANESTENQVQIESNNGEEYDYDDTDAGANVYSGTYHTVTAGQTLYDISISYYGDSSMIEKIKEANFIDDENMIQEGQELLLP